MGLNFKEPKPIFVFYNKETARFEIPVDNGEFQSISGIEGHLVGMRPRIQKYDRFDDALKCDFVFQDGNDQYITPFGVNTLVVRWASYLVLHDIVDLSIPVGFTISKKTDSTVIIPHWYQKGLPINIPIEVWKGFPRIMVRKTSVIDWPTVLGNDDMELVIEHANSYIASKTQNLNLVADAIESRVASANELLEEEAVF